MIDLSIHVDVELLYRLLVRSLYLKLVDTLASLINDTCP